MVVLQFQEDKKDTGRLPVHHGMHELVKTVGMFHGRETGTAHFTRHGWPVGSLVWPFLVHGEWAATQPGQQRARLWRRESLVLPGVNKRALLNRIIARLQSELDLLTRAALSTHAEATDEENKAEDKYDTRGLEASYLAIGQSKAAEEAAQAVAQFSALPARDFGPTEPVSLGALILLETNGHSTRYFMGPRAGGTEIEHEGGMVLVITPQSPLGRQLMGRTQGTVLSLNLGGKSTQPLVAKIS